MLSLEFRNINFAMIRIFLIMLSITKHRLSRIKSTPCTTQNFMNLKPSINVCERNFCSTEIRTPQRDGFLSEIIGSRVFAQLKASVKIYCFRHSKQDKHVKCVYVFFFSLIFYILFIFSKAWGCLCGYINKIPWKINH